MNRFYSANYSNTNHNFVIQNLFTLKENTVDLSTLSVLKNILQRGTPVTPSTFLQKKLGKFHLEASYNQGRPLICSDSVRWAKTIKGDDVNGYYPAKTFFETLLIKYLPKCAFIKPLILPECEINQITQQYSKEFIDQSVDFYLPQAFLVIEVDGEHHNRAAQKLLDAKRNDYLSAHGIETIRFSTREISEENESFKTKIQKIREKLIEIYQLEKELKTKNDAFIGLVDYQNAFNKGIDTSLPIYRATAVIRFQILVLELLINGHLNFNTPWVFEVLSHDVDDFETLALEDLFIWLKRLYQLQGKVFQAPEYTLKKIHRASQFSLDSSIKVDFSLLKRYTDESEYHQEIIYVRTAYLDHFIDCKDLDNPRRAIDYSCVATAPLIEYKDAKKSEQHRILKELAWELFFQMEESLSYENFDFREGQLDIITHALGLNDTIGLLPTGSGKSLCYQLSCLLQPAISFVVCPIKSLMTDQYLELMNNRINRVNVINSDLTPAKRTFVQSQFKKAKYQFIFISPERFQTQDFREYLLSLSVKKEIAYAVIDEAHCVSEWGHDFRTSYLNLVEAIRKYVKNPCFLALTATASANVLKDLRIELGLKNEDSVKFPNSYTREELEFFVIDDDQRKNDTLVDTIKEVCRDDFYDKNKAGLIFTPFVNSTRKQTGCYDLSLNLSKALHKKVGFYSGSAPKKFTGLLQKATGNSSIDAHYNVYKTKIQKAYKSNEINLLVATKAFGMGVNKGNIGYTIHYGLPASLESFYQEAGRAGRAKHLFKEKKAKSFILLTREKESDDALETLWNIDASHEALTNAKKKLNGDLSTQIFFYLSGAHDIKIEAEILNFIYHDVLKSGKKKILISAKEKSALIKNSLALEDSFYLNIEKYIYKLKQLGLFSDWVVDFKTDAYTVFVNDTSIASIRRTLEKNIAKYDPEFSFDNIANGRYKKLNKILTDGFENDFLTYAKILYQWDNDNFAYNRRQSLKTMYESSIRFIDGDLDPDKLKTLIESYFKITSTSKQLQSLIEHPNRYEDWFDLFYRKNQISGAKTFLTFDQIHDLQIKINRQLESYMQNTALDFVSGLTRLVLDDYSNVDGRARLERTLAHLKNTDQAKKDIVFNGLVAFSNHLKLKNKNELVQSIINTWSDEKEFLILLNNKFHDEVSATLFCQGRLQTLLNVLEGIRK